jgi:hypothetical protein
MYTIISRVSLPFVHASDTSKGQSLSHIWPDSEPVKSPTKRQLTNSFSWSYWSAQGRSLRTKSKEPARTEISTIH